jgi:integrase
MSTRTAVKSPSLAPTKAPSLALLEKKLELSDSRVEAAHDFSDGRTIVLCDTRVEGLRVRVGKHRVTFFFRHDDRRNGQRRITVETLGHFPAMTVKEARDAAKIIAGRVAAGSAGPGKRAALRFDDAMTDYLGHLKRKAERAGKPARWAYNVAKLVKGPLARWSGWSLADMATNPGALQKWHRDVTRTSGPVSADHCARIVRAAYRRAAKTDLSLPPRDPTAAVEYNPKSVAQTGMAFKLFPKWLAAWHAIEVGPKAPARKEYHLFCLLTGARPGEAARIRWRDVKPSARIVEIPSAKAQNTIRIVMSAAIARVLKRARDLSKPSGPDDLVFKRCEQLGHREALPVRGHGLRHTWRTVAADVGIDELHAHVMLGHAPKNISESYITRLVLAAGPALRQAQRKVSRRILGLLGTDPTA